MQPLTFLEQDGSRRRTLKITIWHKYFCRVCPSYSACKVNKLFPNMVVKIKLLQARFKKKPKQNKRWWVLSCAAVMFEAVPCCASAIYHARISFPSKSIRVCSGSWRFRAGITNKQRRELEGTNKDTRQYASGWLWVWEKVTLRFKSPIPSACSGRWNRINVNQHITSRECLLWMLLFNFIF